MRRRKKKGQHRVQYKRDWVGIIIVLLFLAGALFAAAVFYRDIIGATIHDTLIVGKFEVDDYEAREWQCHQLKGEPTLFKCSREVQIGL